MRLVCFGVFFVCLLVCLFVFYPFFILELRVLLFFSLEGTFSFEDVDRYILNMMNRLMFGLVFVQAFSFSLCLPAVLSLLGKCATYATRYAIL